MPAYWNYPNKLLILLVSCAKPLSAAKDTRMQQVSVQQEAMKALQVLPGIGPSLAADLWRLGIRRVADLRGADPGRLYRRLNTMTGTRQDPCVLYAFRCAVYAATEDNPDPGLLHWWRWKEIPEQEKKHAGTHR